MTKLAVTFTLVAMFAASAPIVIDAQRFGSPFAGSHGGGGRGDGSRGGGERGDGSRGGGGRGDGGRGGGQPPPHVQGRVNRPTAPPLLSLNRPSFVIDGLNRPSFDVNEPFGIGLVQRSPFNARPGTYTRRSRGPQSFGIPLDYGFGEPGYAPYADTNTYDSQRQAEREAEITTGALFLDVTPSTALAFVDTAYVGTVQDLQARGVTLSPGRHWLDLEAPDFDKKTIEITIRAGEPLRYRVDLTPTRRAEITAMPPRPPETMYAIPGCYGGNRPPVAANLPKGCDITKVHVIRPQPRTN
jgi:hypothetical protein